MVITPGIPGKEYSRSREFLTVPGLEIPKSVKHYNLFLYILYIRIIILNYLIHFNNFKTIV